MTQRWRCTECDATYPTFEAAARCHWGIGGVEEVPVSTERRTNATGNHA